MSHHGMLQFLILHILYKLLNLIIILFIIIMSMGIVGVKSTAGREVKFFNPSKTTKSEST